MVRKDRRREIRLVAADDDLLVEAAGISGVSVTEFLLDRTIPDASAIVQEHRYITLDEDPYRQFLAALDAPMEIPKMLAEQAKKARHLKQVR